jgi:hypothetical protein
MMFNQAPLTSLEEDLREFKLLQEEAGPSTKQPQVKEPDNRGGDYAGPPQGTDDPKETGYSVSVGDQAAGWRANVPVRGDTTSAGVAKAEDEYYDGETVEEGKRLPGFLAAKQAQNEQHETQSAIAEAEAAREELVGRAMAVIESYYSNEEPLGEDEYKAVIDAYAVLADAYDATLEDVTSRFEAVVEGEDEDEDEDPKEGDVDHVFKNGGIKHKTKKNDEDEDEDEKKDESVHYESVTPTIGRARRIMSESSNNGLNSLVSDLKNLEEGLTGNSSESAAVDRHAALIEGFESLRDSAAAICGKILDVIKTEAGVAEDEELDLDGEDERVKIGAFFESIIEDCENHLAAMAEASLDDDTAQEDLSRMSGDVERGIDAMKSVAA